jgi:hypothetical protein
VLKARMAQGCAQSSLTASVTPIVPLEIKLGLPDAKEPVFGAFVTATKTSHFLAEPCHPEYLVLKTTRWAGNMRLLV